MHPAKNMTKPQTPIHGLAQILCCLGALLLAGCSNTDLPDAVSMSATGNTSSSSVPGEILGGAIGNFIDLPEELYISSDRDRLETGGAFLSELYDDAVLETIYIDFEPINFLAQLSANYNLYLADPAAGYTRIAATVRYKDRLLEQAGVSFYEDDNFDTTDKKAFSIDLEWLTPGQDIAGYNELTLKSASQDASAMREVLFANLAKNNIPSAKGNFVNVVVNGENYGLYANIQTLDKDHAKEWFLDNEATRWRARPPLVGAPAGPSVSAFNNLGANASNYESAYTLESSDVLDPWQDLASAARTLGIVSPQFLVQELGRFMDIDATLWFLATENIFTDGEGYINKGTDYYVYFDLETARIVPIEFDASSVMQPDWATLWPPFYRADDAGYPLLNVLLTVPELRQRYLAHYRTLLQEVFEPTKVHDKIDRYVDLITPSIMAPSAVRNFTLNDFQADVDVVKDFFTARYNYLQADIEINQTGPSISSVVDSVDGEESIRPRDDQNVTVSAQVGEIVAREVTLYYGADLQGPFTKMAMTGNADGQYTALIPPFPKGSFVRYYIEAIANDANGTASYSPAGAEHDVYIYQVEAAVSVASDLVINELMASNSATVADELGNYGDWIELYNNASTPVDLSGWFLTDEETNIERWPFPEGTVIQGNGTLIIWADGEDALTSGLHAGFRLSAAGEGVFLVTPGRTFADQVTFDNAQTDVSYSRLPNGTGDFVWTSSPTFDRVNN
jgi:hypothetical protein